MWWVGGKQGAHVRWLDVEGQLAVQHPGSPSLGGDDAAGRLKCTEAHAEMHWRCTEMR